MLSLNTPGVGESHVLPKEEEVSKDDVEPVFVSPSFSSEDCAILHLKRRAGSAFKPLQRIPGALIVPVAQVLHLRCIFLASGVAQVLLCSFYSS